MAMQTTNMSKPSLDVTSSTESWQQQTIRWPAKGRVILAHHDDQHIVVYQAFRSEIAEWAVKHQLFGGPHWSPHRMTWTKTNFLWMMYRCGWATKDDRQSNVLAITITRDAFETLLGNAWNHSWSQGSGIYQSKEEWLSTKPPKKEGVRVQWDPDHDPVGKSQQRKAIQIGIAPDMVEKVWNTTHCIKHIQDITDFVKKQRVKRSRADAHTDYASWMMDETFMLPKETVYIVKDKTLIDRLQITTV
ncbi:unnamed protein product [Meganyctiphanes norvegica]|uniref:DUF4291 domain-containing protein n=1 Tax=Meganyctiphanes norvegica TaxID=48144 RepID=A0AAV2PU47_MEGNR